MSKPADAMTIPDAAVEAGARERNRHKFFRAHPDPMKRPDYMECECGAMVPVMMCEPWEAFERHRTVSMLEVASEEVDCPVCFGFDKPFADCVLCGGSGVMHVLRRDTP
jgi:hypothetical protein